MELKVEGKMFINEPLSAHTTLHLGGRAKYFLMAANSSDISKALSYARNKGFASLVMGRGSNILFSDKGFSGIVVNTMNMGKINVDKNRMIAQSGANLSDVINVAKENSLSGLESLIGIPGSVGGASVMNAGAFDCEIGDYIESAKVLREGKEVKMSDILFYYRQSSLYGEIITEVEFSLSKEEKKQIENKIREIAKRRRNKQPVISARAGTCGSVFKNPEGLSAGELIEKSGLKGMKVGGVEVSRKHCNYFLTAPEATSGDFIDLVKKVREKVRRETGITLELEVKVIGEEKEIRI
jgi:UDP-N-acetylmuramate dehydrogenase